MLSSLTDPRIDYQRLRHTAAARHLRNALFRAFVGRDGWPLVFRRPQDNGPRGTSPNLYVHLPFCRQLCPHCPYTKRRDEVRLHEPYWTRLRREIDQYLSEGDPPEVETLYFGGGTPSATPDLIERTLERLRPWLGRDTEVGVEVHPADVSPALCDQLRRWGVNRVSLGIETFRPDLLIKLGRTYSPEQATHAIRIARNAGFDCVDVNLICAIPGQAAHDPAADVRRCLDLGVDQVSTYTLFTFRHTAVGRRVARQREPLYGDGSRLRALTEVARVCRQAGFRRTSPWNFTRPGVTPYSTVCRESYVGFGVGAGSKVDGVFRFNTFSLEAYLQQPDNRPAIVLQATERVRRFHWVYWALYRTEVPSVRYRQLFGRDVERDFRGTFTFLRLMRMLRRNGADWRVTEFGAIWMHRIQQLFSITYIDDVWEQSQREAWPDKVLIA